jgi:peptide/nickel transport system substrate-binding protein
MTSYIGASILSEAVVTAAGEAYGAHPIGTGPFKFVSWARGDRITLVRNDDYWGPLARTQNLIIRDLSEPATRPIELETGAVDIVYTLQPLDIPRIEANPNTELIRRQTTQITYIAFNNDFPPLNDYRVRRAIAYAIDLESLVAAAYRGLGNPGRGVLPPSVRYFDTTLPPHQYNVERARELLAEAGHADGFSLVFKTNERADRVLTGEIVQQMLRQVGIDLTIQVLEWGAFMSAIASPDVQMYIVGWINTMMDPDYSIFGFLQSASGMNNSRFNDPETDRLLDLGRRTPDGPERAEIYRQIQHRINYLRPILVTWTGEELFGKRTNVRGFYPTATGYHNLSTVYIVD